MIAPESEKFSGFIFKIHANLDPKHRDRIAFLRVCSGKFERNKYFHHVRLDKDVRFNNPYSFLARSKDVIEEAYPGDVVGLFDTGNFKIGDTLTEGENFYLMKCNKVIDNTKTNRILSSRRSRKLKL